jgi:hypothetical protein
MKNKNPPQFKYTENDVSRITSIIMSKDLLNIIIEKNMSKLKNKYIHKGILQFSGEAKGKKYNNFVVANIINRIFKFEIMGL